MELTLKVPDELKPRLRNRKAQLLEILELGLEVIEERAPTPEELVAYARRELDEEARETLAERLALDQEAVDDLLDFERFERLEPPSEQHRLSDGDVVKALEALRERVAESRVAESRVAESRVAESRTAESRTAESRIEDPAPPVSEVVPLARPAARTAPETVPPPRAGPRSAGRRPASRATAWLALAAGLLVAVGIWSSGWPGGGPTAVQGYPIRISSTRAASGVYTAPATAETIQLILDPAGLPAGSRGRLVIEAGDGRVVFKQKIIGAENSESMLFVALSSDRLPSGRYRVEVFDAGTGERVSEPLAFTLRRTPPAPAESSPGERSPGT